MTTDFMEFVFTETHLPATHIPPPRALPDKVHYLISVFYFYFFYFPPAGQRITTIQLDGVQYFVSRMNPYSPELNYFLAYQYCRSLGLQLASFETKEKVESMTQYLTNAGECTTDC